MIEFCHDCGIEQPLVWSAPDWVWREVMERTDGGGVVCPRCFDARARAKGMVLYWKPTVEYRFEVKR
jgi:hypothetical protein